MDPLHQTRERSENLTLQDCAGKDRDGDHEDREPDENVPVRRADALVRPGSNLYQFEGSDNTALAVAEGREVIEQRATVAPVRQGFGLPRCDHAVQRLGRHVIRNGKLTRHQRRGEIEVVEPNAIDRLLVFGHLREERLDVRDLAVANRAL